ncbi:Sensor histidine kinase RcsC [Candidatus Lokiarchaeum ossiferum]|uniref:Sensor histidine kinase RcsC n=1 Tax=Candidatus Lokiarchaeum ossiferum TaxID=2951803 RepID=A0ABY6HV64_9ARCH|nr:Sensor histidine kinase RcsC [Candidatus Lokiarchaeum sp. B-35]
MKILIIDDKKENNYLVERMITKLGYEAILAENGVEALELLFKFDFIMVISDILMPEMDGFQLCKIVRCLKKFDGLKFVFYTATYTEKEDEEFAMELGADKFLRKPMDPQLFLQEIQKLLQKEQADHDYRKNYIKKPEKEIFKLYNERLINKLEKKTRELEKFKQMDGERLRAQKIESLALIAGGIAHDFNNLLVGILGNTNIIQTDKSLSIEVQDSLKDIEKATLRASELTEQLLAFSKDGNIIKETKDITPIIEESISLVLRGSKSKCIINTQKNLPKVEVDSGQMTQVFNNLLINANQSMENGGEIHVSIEVVHISDDLEFPLPYGPYVQISIKDQGVGVPQNVHQHIFEPYFTTKEKGNGLGLATCYTIIKRHGGYISFKSNPKTEPGTTFQIFLPIFEQNYE